MVRASEVLGLIIAVMLTLPVVFTSYDVSVGEEEPLVTFKVLMDPTGGSNVSVPRILGASIDWTDNANGLFDSVSGLLNPVPVSEIIGLDLSHLRFPAGRLSQDYNWTRGVGSDKERGKNPSHTDKPMPSTFGTDEFYKVVNHTGAEPVLITNIHTGTPQMARDWVSYCNDVYWKGKGVLRNANGYSAPYGIKYWEMGNEAYLPNLWKDRSTGDLPAGTLYGKRLKEFSTAMKAVDPSIKIGAWMVLDADEEGFSADQSWNTNFINEASSKMTTEAYFFDYVVLKVNLPDIEHLLNPDELYKYSYAHTYGAIRSNLAQIQGLLAPKAVQRPGGIPIAIASFEPTFGSEGWNTRVPSQAGSAIITADIAMHLIGETMNNGKKTIEYACYGELNTPGYSSLMINPTFAEGHVDTWQRSPNYLAMDMVSELQGMMVLGLAELRNPTYSVSDERYLPGVVDVPLVSALAMSGFPEPRMTIALINRDVDGPVRCRITIDNWPGIIKIDGRVSEFDSLLSDNLGVESVTVRPLDRTDSGPDIELTIPSASIVVVTLVYSGVT